LKSKLIALSLLAAAALFSCAKNDDPPRPTAPLRDDVLAAEQVLHRGNLTEPTSLDPHKGDGTPSSNVQRDLFEGLVIPAADGSLVPGAAERWEISEDGKTYRFFLREEGRWSNGDAVTADDFVFGLRRSADPATLSNYSMILSPIENADAVISGAEPPASLAVVAEDERTLVIRLKAPTPYFIELLTHSTTYPLHEPSLREHGSRFARPGNLVGNGAFVLDEWVVQSHIKLSKSPTYWDRDKVRLETVFYYPIENLNTELKLYRASELDWTDSLPYQQLAWVRKNLPDELHIDPYLGVYYFGFNTSRPPFEGNPGLRQALSMAIDREIITDKVTGAGEIPAYGWVPPLPGYEGQKPDWALMTVEDRLAEARRLYAQAGYGPDKPLEVEIRYNTSENHKRISLAVAAMWKKELGVKATLINQEFKVFLDTRKQKKDTQVFRAAWIGDYRDPFNFLEILHSGHGQNDTGYVSPEYDAFMRRSMSEPEAEARRLILEEAERLLLDDQPVMPIFFYVNRRVVKPWVRGWQSNLLDFHPSQHFYILEH
jgi:oligopeptide transport system substrate-binding protein